MSQPSPLPKYRFYATLLDAFSWYQRSESDTAFQEFIDKINRVPFSSEAADKGTAFNAVVDELLVAPMEIKDGQIVYGDCVFPAHIVRDFVNALAGAVPQVRISAPLSTRLGLVEVYGVIDAVLPACVQVDIKTTTDYTMPKYLRAWQHIVYPYCAYQKAPADYQFTYLITDFSGIYREDYHFQPERDTSKLREHCEALIEFIEQHRGLITDAKIFGLPSILLAHHDKEAKATIIEPA